MLLKPGLALSLMSYGASLTASTEMLRLLGRDYSKE
jgi:hypothetical protein